MKDGGKGRKKVPIYRHEPNYSDRWIMLNSKSRVKIKQNDRRWAFKRHSKEFEIKVQDRGAIMGKRGTRALRRYLWKNLSPPCAPLSLEN